MRINDKDEALDLLFSEARKEKSPVSYAEAIQLLQAKNTDGFKRFFNQKTILMMTSAFVTFSLLFYFLNPIHNQRNDYTQENPEKIINDYPSISHSEKDLKTANEQLQNLDKQPIKKLNSSNSAPNNIVETQKEDIQEITPTPDKLIELPEEILAKMNITFTYDGICLGDESDLHMCYNYGGTKLSVKDEFNKNDEEIMNRITPVLITDADGKNWRSTSFNEEMDKEFMTQYADSNYNSELYSNYIKENYNVTYPDLQNETNELYSKHLRKFVNKQVNSFIPILVRLPEKYKSNVKLTGTNWGHDLILWYQPTEAFLSLLPDSIVTQVKPGKENTVFNSVKKEEIFEKPKTFNKISLSLYPNPVMDKATINYRLDKNKKVNITLHDVSGRLVKVFVRNETRSAGNNSMEIDLQNLIQGIYILSIETADGNILTQRVIKQ